jgi:hypothetical protein
MSIDNLGGLRTAWCGEALWSLAGVVGYQADGPKACPGLAAGVPLCLVTSWGAAVHKELPLPSLLLSFPFVSSKTIPNYCNSSGFITNQR